MSETNEEFFRQMENLLVGLPRTPFKPDAWYNRTGDLIEALFEPVSYYAEWINHRLTILRAQDDKRVVGCQITWVRSAVAGESAWSDEY